MAFFLGLSSKMRYVEERASEEREETTYGIECDHLCFRQLNVREIRSLEVDANEVGGAISDSREQLVTAFQREQMLHGWREMQGVVFRE
jgi:hypothetical protein